MQLMLFDFILKNVVKNWRKLLSWQNKKNIKVDFYVLLAIIYKYSNTTLKSRVNLVKLKLGVYQLISYRIMLSFSSDSPKAIFKFIHKSP